MKTIKVTYIDTAGHGYYSVSKDDLRLIGINPFSITGFSGMNLTRVYLEEDCDATTFFDKAKANGFTVEVKNSYNENHKIKHNYNADLFDYVPTTGHIVTLSDGREYQISTVDERGIFVRDLATRMVYKISNANPFEHIKKYSTVLAV